MSRRRRAGGIGTGIDLANGRVVNRHAIGKRGNRGEEPGGRHGGLKNSSRSPEPLHVDLLKIKRSMTEGLSDPHRGVRIPRTVPLALVEIGLELREVLRRSVLRQIGLLTLSLYFRRRGDPSANFGDGSKHNRMINNLIRITRSLWGPFHRQFTWRFGSRGLPQVPSNLCPRSVSSLTLGDSLFGGLAVSRPVNFLPLQLGKLLRLQLDWHRLG